MSKQDRKRRPIVLVPHYLSVEVYAELGTEINVLSGDPVHLLVLSSRDAEKALAAGLDLESVRVFESAIYEKVLDFFDLDLLEKKYPTVPWGAVVASERSFVDYCFTFGGSGARSEDKQYISSFLLKLIAFFDVEFDRLNPRAVITVFGDNIYTHVASIVAEQKGIPIILPHASYVNENRSLTGGFFGNTRLLESYAMVRHYLQYRFRNLSAEERIRSDAFAENLRSYDGSKTLEFIYKKKDFERPLSPNVKKIISYIRDHRILDKRVYFYKVDILKKIQANLYRLLRNKQFASFIKNHSKDLPKDKIVFFPMHFQPEASTLVNGIWHSNQVGFIENLSKALPLGYNLVVKEHPRGRGMRPIWQYKHLASLHNVTFCDLPSKEILQHSDAVVTISGTIGLEALAMRKPVIMFGRTFHSFHTVYYYARSMEQATKLLQDILLRKDFEERKNLDEDIRKVFLAYINALYDFFPFGEQRQSLAFAVLNELEHPTNVAKDWIETLHGSA